MADSPYPSDTDTGYGSPTPRKKTANRLISMRKPNPLMMQ